MKIKQVLYVFLIVTISSVCYPLDLIEIEIKNDIQAEIANAIAGHAHDRSGNSFVVVSISVVPCFFE